VVNSPNQFPKVDGRIEPKPVSSSKTDRTIASLTQLIEISKLTIDVAPEIHQNRNRVFFCFLFVDFEGFL